MWHPLLFSEPSHTQNDTSYDQILSDIHVHSININNTKGMCENWESKLKQSQYWQEIKM